MRPTTARNHDAQARPGRPRPHVRPAAGEAAPLASRLRPRRDDDRMTRVYRTIGGGLVADFGRD